MRWDDLFDDLEGQAEHARRQDLAAEVADRTRREQATVVLADRVRAARGALTWSLLDGSTLVGRVLSAGPGWYLLTAGAGPEADGPQGRQVLLPADAVVGVRGVPDWSAPPLSPVAARRTFLMALRALGEAGVRVRVRTATGSHVARLGRVGADHVDLLPGEGADRDEVLTLPFAAVLAVHEAP
ncbi:hypothetical protein AB1207_12205 [Kineococcus endophyticus]|uniref:Uncharacterized protein n=1 Tax=Kineococcus endophyticus TaxID=1181883 RepID=A0ABV3P7A0_9ACTN